MWLWLLKGSPKLKIFILKIISLSIILHFFILFLLLFVYQDNTLHLLIKTNSNNIAVPIVFLPMQKTVRGALKSLNKSAKENIAAKKNNIIIINNKTINNKVNKKEVIKKKEAKKENKSEKKIEIKEKIKEIKEEINNIQENIIKTPENPEPVFLGRKDMEIVELEDEVKQEIKNNWRPPAGLSKNLESIVKVGIDLNGKINDFKIEKSSKSIAFDMSIRRDIYKNSWPKKLWGKQITLTFK